jgi:hypothetical protein
MSEIRFPVLTTERYLDAVERAKQNIRDRIEPPKLEAFKVESATAYPRWFSVGVITALVLVLIFSFVISAGKQTAAMGLILDPLPEKFQRLSPDWANWSIGLMLLMSEVGAVLFLVASGTLAATAPTSSIAGHEVNITRWIFRLFAFLCAGYAIASNITVNALEPIPDAWVLQWMVGIGAPSTVLGLGFMLERMVINGLKASTEQKQNFIIAMKEHKIVINDPVRHEYYKQSLVDSLFTELVRFKADRLKLLVAYPDYETNQQVKLWLVSEEYKAHQAMQDFDLEVITRPFLEPTTD